MFEVQPPRPVVMHVIDPTPACELLTMCGLLEMPIAHDAIPPSRLPEATCQECIANTRERYYIERVKALPMQLYVE